MTKKLYVVEVLYTAYVWADSEQDAERFSQDVQFENPEINAYAASTYTNGTVNPLRWPVDALIYHQGNYDMTLLEALEAEQQP